MGFSRSVSSNYACVCVTAFDFVSSRKRKKDICASVLQHWEFERQTNMFLISSAFFFYTSRIYLEKVRIKTCWYSSENTSNSYENEKSENCLLLFNYSLSWWSNCFHYTLNFIYRSIWFRAKLDRILNKH